MKIVVLDLKITIFWQVVEIDSNQILACGFRHTHRCNLNIRLKPSAESRTYGTDVCWGRQKWQLSVSIYSTLALPPHIRCLFFWEGRHPLSRVLDDQVLCRVAEHKTGSSFGSQPLFMDATTEKVMQLYIKHWRSRPLRFMMRKTNMFSSIHLEKVCTIWAYQPASKLI